MPDFCAGREAPQRLRWPTPPPGGRLTLRRWRFGNRAKQARCAAERLARSEIVHGEIAGTTAIRGSTKANLDANTVLIDALEPGFEEAVVLRSSSFDDGPVYVLDYARHVARIRTRERRLFTASATDEHDIRRLLHEAKKHPESEAE